jgi:hypothetical protein
MWSNKYIGIPYKEKGRDLDGTDCWGLVRLVYEREYNIILPSFSGEYIQQDIERIQDLVSQYKEGWEPIDQPVEGCVVVFRILGTESHIGVAVSGTHFLHAREGQDSAVESFDSPQWNKRIVGYFKYVENTQLMTAMPHPLRTERFTLPITPGTTVLELVGNINQKYNIQPELGGKVLVMVAGKPIPESEWPLTTIEVGDSVEYRAVATGGNSFRMFAMLAMVIIAPEIALSIGNTAGLTAATTYGAFAAASPIMAAAITAGVSMVGMMLINAIAPIRPPAEAADPGSSERQLMVTGSANRANPYGSIPVVLGRVKLTPPLGANNFISYQNERDTYLTMLLVWGYGPLQIDAATLKIGDVALSEFVLDTFSDGSQKFITLDRKTEPTEEVQTKFDSIYGSDVFQDNDSLVLACNGNPEDTNITPGPWKVSAYAQAVNKVIVALHFPQGLRKIKVKGDGAGDSTNTTVKVRFEVKIGSGDWVLWKTVTYGTDAVKKDAFTVTETYDVSNQAVSVRVRRETGDNTEDNPDHRYSHEITFLSATYFKTNTKPTRDPKNCKIAKTALQIKASEQLNNQIEGINAIVETWCLSWNGTTWAYAATNNPADLYRYVLQHPANPQRILDSEISTKLNLAEIQRWHDYCVTKGFTYNSVMGSQRSVLDTLRDICAAGRASPAMLDGKWSVVIDEPKSTIIQHFTPHNSWGFESTKALPKLPDALKISFYDEDQNYQEVESIVYNIGKNIDNAELFESISLPGVTKSSLVIDHAKWHMAQAILRKEVYTLNTDIEYIVCNRGDRVKVTHDVPMWGLGSGRVKNRLSSTVMELDESLPMELLKNYTIRFRSSTGASTDFTVLKSFTISGGSRTNDTVTINITTLSHPIQVGDKLTIASSNTALNTSSAEVTEVGTGYFKYVLAGSNISNGTITGTAKLNDGYYDTIGLTTTSIIDEVNSNDLFLFGEYQQEAQDLIITNIEPTSNKSARITMVDYGVTSTYNIFTDYQNLTEATVFETQITQPAKGLLNSFGSTDKPTITYIQSDDLVADLISPGTYAYKIKVSYANPTTLPNTVGSVECQYAYSSTTNSSGYKSIIVEYKSNTVEIPNVIAGEEYKIRLRYLSNDGRVGLWSTWLNHTVSGKLVNYNTVTSVSVKRSKKTLVITPFTSTMPNDFKYFEIKVFKDPGTGDFWTSTDTSIKTYTSVGTLNVNLSDFVSPRLSHTGTKYRIACRMLDNAGNYSTSSALTSIVLYDISP